MTPERWEQILRDTKGHTTGPYFAVLPRDQHGHSVAHAGPTWSDGFPAATSIRSETEPANGWEQAAIDAALLAAAPELLDEVERLRGLLVRQAAPSDLAATLVAHAADLRGLPNKLTWHAGVADDLEAAADLLPMPEPTDTKGQRAHRLGLAKAAIERCGTGVNYTRAHAALHMAADVPRDGDRHEARLAIEDCLDWLTGAGVMAEHRALVEQAADAVALYARVL